MNDYDDSEDYSSSNSFRARSNTWPLNRPDLAVPNGVCIDETLPEIELEEDDLFTTNENWSTGLVDHDIMSWDPILNAQGHNNHHHHHHHHQHHQQQQQTTTNSDQQPHQHHQATTVHHHHHHNQPSTQGHQRQQSIHQQPQLQQHHNNHHQQQQRQNETVLSDSTIIIGGQVQQQQSHQHQQAQQLPPQHHQTLNNTHCFDTDDPSDYHVHQHMHHLRLDNNQISSDQQTHYISSLSPMCVPGSTTALGNDSFISSDHQHHQLQPLTSARYDLDQQNDLDLKSRDDDHQHQLHHLTSSSLDHHSHMLSSSLSTSGIGLSGDLEDLDYKATDSSAVLQNSSFEDQHQDQQGGECSSNKQSNSTTSSKTKLNTPRRNAWGNMSYADLISQAINSTNDKRLTLSQIYDWMVQHVPYFKDKGDSNSSAGWKNSVRHNLSLHNRFKRLQNEGTGKSSWWTINPEANIGKCARRRAASMEASKYEKKRGRAKKRAEAIRQGLVSYPSLTNSSLNGSTSALEQPPHHQSSIHLVAQEQQQSEGLNSDNLHNRQHNTGLFVASSQETQYEQKDNNMPQQQQQQPQTQTQPQQQQSQSQTPCHPQPQTQPQPDTAPALQVAAQQQQPKQEQQPTPKRVQQPQVHHQLQKMETHDTDSYYIQQHDLQHQDQHQQHQILSSNDHMDLFGRHAIYMSEPCNDCNCTELINCGTNAMSFT